MNKIVLREFADLTSYIGQELGISDLFTVTQAHVDKFAEATLDHQWIHKNTERTRMESPFKAPIAHGYFTISLIPYLWAQMISIDDAKFVINYEIERLRFSNPVVVGNKVRLYTRLLSMKDLRGVNKVRVEVNLKIEDTSSMAFTGVVTFLYDLRMCKSVSVS